MRKSTKGEVKKRPRHDLSTKPKIKAKRKKAAEKKPKKERVPKTRNAGTMTEASFWSFIRAALRQKSRWWKPIAKCKRNARRDYKGPNKRQRFEYLCNICGNYYPDKEIQIDHINPVGSLQCGDDLKEFVDRLFCEEDGLQSICTNCHNSKTQEDLILIKQRKLLKSE